MNEEEQQPEKLSNTEELNNYKKNIIQKQKIILIKIIFLAQIYQLSIHQK
jgi:hypothetical protein